MLTWKGVVMEAIQCPERRRGTPPVEPSRAEREAKPPGPQPGLSLTTWRVQTPDRVSSVTVHGRKIVAGPADMAGWIGRSIGALRSVTLDQGGSCERCDYQAGG